MKHIKEIRYDIDECDKGILELLEKRLNLSLKIAEIKKKNDLQLYDKEREKEIFFNNSKLINDINKLEYINNVFKSILNESKKYQKNNLKIEE